MNRLDYWNTMFPYFGSRKLVVKLKDEGFDIGRKRICRLMDEMGIYAIYPKKNLSKPNKQHRKFPYLLRNIEIQFPNQVWAIDVSYIPMKNGFMYLTAIIDWHSRYIVGYELSDTLEAIHCVNAMKRAIKDVGVPGILNSDQAAQLSSDDFVNLLESHKIRQSMDGKGRWVDNVVVERWFRSLKTEYIYINEFSSPRELREGIAKYIDEYNNIRPHQALADDTPSKVYNEAFSSYQVA